jgi:hypothetical protein
MSDPVMRRIARRYRQGLITSEWAHYLTARHLGTDAWGAVVALADAVGAQLPQR